MRTLLKPIKGLSKKSKWVVGAALVLLIVLLIFFITLQSRQQEERAVKQQKQNFEALVQKPEQLFLKAQAESSQDSVLRKIDYKNTQYVSDMMQLLLRVMDGKDVRADALLAQSGDSEAKKRNKTILALLGQNSFSKAMQEELGITNTPSARNLYTFISKDYVLSTQSSEQELSNVIVKNTEEFCVAENYNCLKDGKTGKSTTNNLITMRVIKIKDSPLTYRVYAISRSAVTE